MASAAPPSKSNFPGSRYRSLFVPFPRARPPRFFSPGEGRGGGKGRSTAAASPARFFLLHGPLAPQLLPEEPARPAAAAGRGDSRCVHRRAADGLRRMVERGRGSGSLMAKGVMLVVLVGRGGRFWTVNGLLCRDKAGLEFLCCGLIVDKFVRFWKKLFNRSVWKRKSCLQSLLVC